MAPLPPIARRKFTVSSPPSSGPSTLPSRHLKRVYIAAELLKAAKICTGDVIVVRAALEGETKVGGGVGEDGEDEIVIAVDRLALVGEEEKSQEVKEERFAVGVAWPSFELPGTRIAISSLLLANAGLSLESTVSICPLDRSGVQLLEAETVNLIYDSPLDAKGKGKKKANDSFFEAYVKEIALDTKYFGIKHTLVVTYQGVQRRLLVSSFTPTTTLDAPTPSSTSPTALFVTRNTSFSFSTPTPTASTQLAVATTSTTPLPEQSNVPYSALGGLTTQIAQIRELVEWPLTRPELYQHFGLQPPRGILLHGPSGTGKTLLARSIAHSLYAPILSIDGPSLSSAFHGETESSLRSVFASARSLASSNPAKIAVIIIDEIDALAPNREEAGEVDRRVVATLLVEMDGLGGKKMRVDGEDAEGEVEEGRVLVVAATNRPNAIDPALRRPGRFDKEIEIGVPDAASRLSILEVLLSPIPNSLSPTDLLSLSSQTHGFVGADLSSLVHTAGLAAIRRTYPLLSSPTPPPLSSLLLTSSDLSTALLSTRPSALREVFLETPKVKWSDIGGMKFVRDRLTECVEWPLSHPETFKKLGVRPPKGVLLYGPPGCSKTLIAKALATEGGLNFIAVKGPEIFNKYVGESEKAIRELFRKARSAAPSIIFLDEVDALAASRGSDEGAGPSDRVLLTLLTEMDGIEELNGVVVLAATNRPDVIDAALMRPGRLDRILYVSPPDLAARKQIFSINMEKMAVAKDVDVDELALLTDGCSGAELVSICQDAALAAMNESLDVEFVSRNHFVTAAKAVRRRITRDMVIGYEKWRDSSGLRSA